MFRVGIITDKQAIGKTVKTKGEAEDDILAISEKETIKRADILNKESGERERVF